MFIKIICLSLTHRPVDLGRAAVGALTKVAGLCKVEVHRVLRHIPSDSVPDNQAHRGVVPQADHIDFILELYFNEAQEAKAVSQSQGWIEFLQKIGQASSILFILDTESNVPIEPKGSAMRGGFRRWMLLARRAKTQREFRNAWFGRHADLVKKLPSVEGYLQNLVLARYNAQGQAADYEALTIDAVAELCFADEAAMHFCYTSPARLPLRDDGRELLGRITTVLVQSEVFL